MQTYRVILAYAAMLAIAALPASAAQSSGTGSRGTGAGSSAGSGAGSGTGSGTGTDTVDTTGSGGLDTSGTSNVTTSANDATGSGSGTTSGIGSSATLGGSTTSGSGSGASTRGAGSAAGGSTTSGLGGSTSGAATTGARAARAGGAAGAATPGAGAAGTAARATGATAGTMPTTLGTSVGVTSPAARGATGGTTIPAAAGATGGRTTPGAGAGATTAGVARTAATAAIGGVGAAGGGARAGAASTGAAPMGPIVIMPLWRAAAASATAASGAAAGDNYGAAGFAGSAGAAPMLTVVAPETSTPVHATADVHTSAAAGSETKATAAPAAGASASSASTSPATGAATSADQAAPAVAAAGGASTAAAAQARTQVTVSVARDAPAEPLYAGEPVTLKIVMHNGGSAAVLVPDWEHFADMVAATVRVSGSPGLASAAGAAQAPPAWTGAAFQKSDFRPLPPGDTTVLRTFVPALSGKVDITVGVRAPSDSYLSLADGKTVKLADAWMGEATARLTLDVSNAESPALKAHLADVRAQLADRLVPADVKGRLLADVAAEQSYAATRFLRTVYEEQPAGPLRDMALGQILRLARVGTAYESVPVLLKAMNDPATSQSVRVGILDWTAESLAAGGKMNLADQGEYVWSADLQKQARAAVEQAQSDRNPYFANRARTALGAIGAAKQ